MYVYKYLYIRCKAQVSKPSNTNSVAICHTRCNTLQHTTTHCNTLQHNAITIWIFPPVIHKYIHKIFINVHVYVNKYMYTLQGTGELAEQSKLRCHLLYANTNTEICIYICICMHVYIFCKVQVSKPNKVNSVAIYHIRIHLYKYSYVNVFLCIYIYVYIRIYMCIYICISRYG